MFRFFKRSRRTLRQGNVKVACFHRHWPKDEWEATAKYENYEVTGHGASAEAARDDWCARVLVEVFSHAVRTQGR
jgi:hypothetical protein